MAVVKGDANPPSRASTTSRPTIRDVARAAGVSQSTTSRALRNQGYVAAEVRERVHKVAAKLGYVPDVMARHLRQRVSRAIGVLVSDLRNSFYADLAAGASRAAQRAGYMVMLVDDRLLADEELEASEGLRLDAVDAATYGGNGYILLFHVGAQSQDANALPCITTRLKSRGFTFGTVPQVIAP